MVPFKLVISLKVKFTVCEFNFNKAVIKERGREAEKEKVENREGSKGLYFIFILVI